MREVPTPVQGAANPTLTGRLWSRPQRTRLYASGRGSPRSRRATDLVLLALCVVGVVALGELSEPPSAFEQALIAVAVAVPAFLDVVWNVGVALLSLWGVFLVFVSLVRWRVDILRDQLFGLLGAAVIVTVVTDLVAGDEIDLWSSLTATGPPADPVSVRLALVSAVTVVASPHITRPFRTTSRWLVGLGAVSLVLLEAATPSGAALGVLCGTIAGAIVHLLVGSTGGRPSLDGVRRGLEELGVEVTSLSEGRRQRAGVFVLDATDPDGLLLVVRVYGRDAWDSQLLAKAWRALWYRDAEALTLTRVQQAEHEAFATLFAARDGVPVHRVVRAGRTTGGDALIVLQVRGVPLDGHEVDEALLDAMWHTLLTLAAAGFAHGDLAPELFRVDGGDVVVDGLAGVVVAPSEDQRRIDVAQLLVCSALLAGPRRAVDAARRCLGAEDLAAVVPYLQVAAMGTRLRQSLDNADLDLDELRAAVARSAGIEEPELAKLRRVSAASLVRAGLLAAAGYFFISMLAGVDVAELVDALSQASLALLLVALAWGQLPRLPQAESTRAACPRPIPFGPVALLQFAITFVNLAIPSTFARVGVSVRFFQRRGIPSVSAMSIGVVDSVAGFAIQMLILVSVALLGLADFNFQNTFDVQQEDLLAALTALIAVVLLVALLAVVVPRARNWVLGRVRPWIREAIETVAILRTPSRVARLLGANLAAELLFATTLGIVLAAFGTSLPLATLLVINVSVALFAGIMPVPGGIGVSEGAYVLLLTAAGLDDATAFGVAIAYRMVTCYLPPIWGAAAFRRLEADGQL